VAYFLFYSISMGWCGGDGFEGVVWIRGRKEGIDEEGDEVR